MAKTITVGDILERVDELEPNQYAADYKLRWLSELDGLVFEEVIRTHEDPIREEFEPYTAETDELLIPFPYGGDIYCWFLQAKIAAENSEAAKYMQNSAFYEAALQEWMNRYNQQHMPVRRVSRFLF